MPKHKKSRSTGRLGVIYVCSIVEKANCILHKTEMENDLGIDGFIELVHDEEASGKLVAVQIKSGNSYYDAERRLCTFSVGNHYLYWSEYSLPVYGIVFVPSLNQAFWIDIKQYFSEFPNCTTIRFNASEVNLFDESCFMSIFVPKILKEIPDLDYEKASQLFHSRNYEEFYLGLITLFRRFPNRREVWDAFLKYFVERRTDEIPGFMIYIFAYIPWHQDICGIGEQLTTDTRTYVKKKFAAFGKSEIIKLLSFVDEENMISRGSLGQSVEAIVSAHPDNNVLLKAILTDRNQPIHIKEAAGVIFAYNYSDEAIPYLESLAFEGSSFMGEIACYIQEWGFFNPYA